MRFYSMQLHNYLEALPVKTIYQARLLFLSLLLSVFLLACTDQRAAVPASPTPKPTSPAAQVDQDQSPAITATASMPTANMPTATPSVSKQEPTAPALLPPKTESPAEPDQLNSRPAWPSPEPLPNPFSGQSASAEQLAAYEQLSVANPPIRDDIELSRAYGGWEGTISQPPVTSQTLEVGTTQSINILNNDLNTHIPIQVELRAVSDHAYFWFDTGPGSTKPTPSRLAEVSEVFDRIYEINVDLFGSEANPGVDGDPRLHVINASPLALCDVTEEDSNQCGLAGYFDHSNIVPSTVDPTSNAREMFVMNVDYFWSDFYFNVLAHEFRHMIENNLDRGEVDWVAEGSAMLAEDLNGYSEVGLRRGNLFLANPDQQLNRWTDEDANPYYGQAYLLNRYIYDRLGPDFYRQLASSSETGLQAIETTAEKNGLDHSGIDIWLDWLVSLAVHDLDGFPGQYSFGLDGLDTIAISSLDDLPIQLEETVNQFAADYYRLSSEADLELNFEGSTLVPVLGTAAASGDQMWFANRGNFRHMHLTRSFDLSDVEAATLAYSVYHDIEAGFDFAYVFISEDGGLTWDSLIAPNMQGTDPVDDPSQSALAERFYTGHSNGWRSEQIDLTPYTGKPIMIRMAYTTDLIHTQGGIAFDNISVPEIGFFDDGEQYMEGWKAQGFERVTASIPQTWHLQLITFQEGKPKVQRLSLTPENTLSMEIPMEGVTAEPILIVSASAPMTLEPAHYRLTITN